jgi:APA family basic amino acid/polyamine antiporter
VTTSAFPDRSAGTKEAEEGFVRSLGLLDSVMVVVGAMIGSGIFLVSADMARILGSAPWVLVAWAIAAVLTVAAALSYGELAAMMPRAGGQYVYLREAFSPLAGFLYGWTLFTVIQTGTTAAVCVGFARYAGVWLPGVSEETYLLPPTHLTPTYAISLSTTQLLAIAVIVVLTWINMRGLQYGRLIQNVFTTAKVGALVALIGIGLGLGWNGAVVSANFGDAWLVRRAVDLAPGVNAATGAGLLAALAVAQVGALFAADAWNNITFTAGEVRNPRRNIPLSLAAGTGIVMLLFLLANLAYFATLPLGGVQQAPSDRVAAATLEGILPGLGGRLMALGIMISTFGCANALILSGARAYYAMARDRLFFRRTGVLNRHRVPGAGLVAQGIGASVLVLPRAYDSAAGTYSNLYGSLLDYVVSAALVFYILTIAGIFRLRWTRPDEPRPYRAFGYPYVPALYLIAGTAILLALFVYRASTTWPGMAIVALGVPVYVVAARFGGRLDEAPAGVTADAYSLRASEDP